MVVLLTDEHFVEGIIGGIGAFFAIKIKKAVPGINPLVLATIGFMTVWYMRKIGMNLYKEHKKIKQIQASNIEINMNPLILAFAILMTLLYVVKPKNILDTVVWLGIVFLIVNKVFF